MGQGASMLEDEEVRPAKKGRLEPLLLDPLSVADLEAYILELRAEIARAETAISHKGSARNVADSFFKRS
jgi:uncharacterized small protein (DUF1192 family)